jgi:exodeoxyribonuclease III
MRIITWNCNMAFRKKAANIFALKPDILVVPECENPERLKFLNNNPPTATLWYGENNNKGLGVFSYTNFSFKINKKHNPDFKTIIPLTATNGKIKLNLFAIWANNPTDKDGSYITQVWKAMHFYEDLLKKPNTILIGDFNSNTIWDKPQREGNHSTVVEILAQKNILSTYHSYYKVDQGKEIHPTFYLYRHQNKPYHLDYCFVSKNLLKKLIDVQIGSFEVWKEHSDHTPLIATFESLY